MRSAPFYEEESLNHYTEAKNQIMRRKLAVDTREVESARPDRRHTSALDRASLKAHSHGHSAPYSVKSRVFMYLWRTACRLEAHFLYWLSCTAKFVEYARAGVRPSTQSPRLQLCAPVPDRSIAHRQNHLLRIILRILLTDQG